MHDAAAGGRLIGIERVPFEPFLPVGAQAAVRRAGNRVLVDADGRGEEARDEVKALRDQGKCIIYSTHIMREVEKLCHRIAIIYRGRILAMGSVQELADQYDEPDMEELFFKLIDRHEEDLAISLVS